MSHEVCKDTAASLSYLLILNTVPLLLGHLLAVVLFMHLFCTCENFNHISLKIRSLGFDPLKSCIAMQTDLLR